MKLRSLNIFVITLFVIISGLQPVNGYDKLTDTIDWNKVPPSQIHQKLAADKAAALQDKQLSRSIMATSDKSLDQVISISFMPPSFYTAR